MQEIEWIRPENKERVYSNGLHEMRENTWISSSEQQVEISIAVLAYNKIEKTKYCIQCLLEHTKDIQYELILIDNGSTDGTLEYFQSIEFPGKRILRVENNIGAMGGYSLAFRKFTGKYLVMLNQDVYVTVNWLTPMLRCMQSDRRVGMVCPMATNTSNRQSPEIVISSMEELHKKARIFNRLNPAKWEERLRLIPVLAVYRREALEIVGMWDTGFWHDFADDDLSFRIRRAGYKLVLCGDVLVCHDHPRDGMSVEAAERFENELQDGRRRFREKYHGIDAWDDICNFETGLMNMLPVMGDVTQEKKILGVDVRCGTPLLELKNKLKAQSVTSVLYGYTTEAKYFEDLNGVCTTTLCEPIENLLSIFGNSKFDYIICGEPINLYAYPLKRLEELLLLVKPGGSLLCKWRNGYDYKMLLVACGLKARPDDELPLVIPIKRVLSYLRKQNTATKVTLSVEGNIQQNEDAKRISEAIARVQGTDVGSNLAAHLLGKNYLLCIQP